MPPLRIVQWTTGLVARQAVKAIVARPDLELVGVYAFSPDKVGQDASELTGLAEPTGVLATDDIDALVALQPDCVVYMPLHPDVDHLVRLLEAGINVATTAFVTGRVLGDEARSRLHEAALAGGATLFGNGIHPGHTDFLAVLASGLCSEIRHVRVLESVDLTLWAGEATQDEFGWGRPKDDPGHAEDVERATLVDVDSLDLIAQLLGITLDATRCEVTFAHATRDLDIPGRPVKEGHVAGIDIRWIGVWDGADVIEVNLRWTLGADLEPAWDPPAGFVFEVRGNPCITMRLDFLPEDLENLTLEEMAGFGQLITAMPVVNALRSVVAAEPGLRTLAEIPAVVAPVVPIRA